ncbi:MAG: exo-alpha-sialidase [Planctomycetota bacterium]
MSSSGAQRRRVGCCQWSVGSEDRRSSVPRLMSNLVVAIWLCAAHTGWAQSTPVPLAQQPGVKLVEFVYERAPFPECHASSIAATESGELVVAWFGGMYEKHPDVGIWIARRSWKKGDRNSDDASSAAAWSAPVEVVNGKQADGSRHPCWNPVLHQVPKGPLLLFYKVGPSPSTWWGMLTESRDGGRTWSTATRLPDQIAGPIKNKPVLLKDGRLLCGSSTEDQGWRVHLEWTSDGGKSWERTGVLADPKQRGAIQPTILQQSDGSLRILCRSRSGGQLLSATSTDQGREWSALEALDLPNPNSGVDAVTLSDGQHLLVYNHTAKGRSPLNVAVSRDGVRWSAALVLESEPGEYSYPAVIQSADGLVHITYTWKRQKLRHIVVDPEQLKTRPITGANWPSQ